MRVYDNLVPGWTAHRWLSGVLNTIFPLIGCLAVMFVGIMARLQWLGVTGVVLSLAGMWVMVISYCFFYYKVRAEQRAGYLTVGASEGDTPDGVVQVDPATGVVIREKGHQFLKADGSEWKQACARARAFLDEQDAAGMSLPPAGRRRHGKRGRVAS